MRKKSILLNKAQAAFEYAILITVVAAAIAAITAYCQQAVNARVQDIKEEYVPER